MLSLPWKEKALKRKMSTNEKILLVTSRNHMIKKMQHKL
jgi:hypothetical protein